MTISKALAGVTAICIALAGLTVSASGCDKKETETEETEEPKEETKEEETKEETDEGDTGEVETYPNMTKAGGTFRLLRSFQVHQAADESSPRLTGLAKGTLVDFKFFHADWVMVDWPSGVGQLSPGWIHLAVKQRSNLTRREQRKVDAGKPSVVDAGPKDAGKKAEVDAGKKRKRTFKFRRGPSRKK